MEQAILIIFFISFIFILSSYLIYPAAIQLLGTIKPFTISSKESWPSVSIIISAYNEEKHIEGKIENTLNLDYSVEEMEILVGSDGSSDATPNLLKKFIQRGVTVVNYKTNRGKTAVQNDLVQQAKGEILVFTDAASFLTPDALKKIVYSFSDNRVGCVAGRMLFINTNQNLTTQSQGLYWQYESYIRKIESEIGSLIGVDGPLYAVRRSAYVPLGHDMISDFLTPLLVLEQGKKVIMEPEALVYEEPKRKAQQEFTTRRRITLRALIGISAYRRLLNPIKYPLLSFQITFHKILRWAVGPMAVVNCLTCLLLSADIFFKIIFMLYSTFFILAMLGWYLAHHGQSSRLLTVPYYFTLVNAAAAMGIYDFAKNRQATTWKTERD